MKKKSVNLPGSILLASNSKRRYYILNKFFKVYTLSPKVSEIESSKNFKEMVIENSKIKAYYALTQDYFLPIVSGDTIVVFNDKIFGKPKDKNEAKYMLNQLSGNWHFVYSGFYFILNNKKEYGGYSIAKVKFKKLTKEMIENYIETNEPFGKAGAYAIQGLGSRLIEKFEGCFFTIVGFPVIKFIKKLKEALCEDT